MSSESVWIVIESISPVPIPIMTYDHNRSALRLGTSLHQPLWGDSSGFPMGLNPHKGIVPESPNFIKPHNFPNRDMLSSIRLVGVFGNLESAQGAVSCAPNRKILGPTVIQ